MVIFALRALPRKCRIVNMAMSITARSTMMASMPVFPWICKKIKAQVYDVLTFIVQHSMTNHRKRESYIESQKANVVSAMGL